ncbi:MAG: cell envelope integrity protein CreD, partial [Pseudomonadota bacterium]
MSGERSPGVKLIIVGVIGAVLMVPLAMVFALVFDRQHQARVAQNSITAAWAGPQVVAGPLLVVPYTSRIEYTETVDGKPVQRTREARRTLYLSPAKQTIDATLDPEVRVRGSIHRTVVYEAAITGKARFALPPDLDRLGVNEEDLILDEAIVQMPISDPRGLQTDAQLSADGDTLDLRPGLGSKDEGTGVHAFFDWSEGEEVTIAFTYGLRGSTAFSLVPRGEETDLAVNSAWRHPSFTGAFLPSEGASDVSEDGFKASWSISNLALGQSLVSTEAPRLPFISTEAEAYEFGMRSVPGVERAATIRLIEPVDLYKQVERSLKYGFLFIGFTFLTFLMFDIVGGARVASAEYGLTGAGLILFFVMLLAFAEVIGFGLAYLLASGAVIALLTSYSAAVLGGWRRAGFIAALLTGLYAVLYVLLNLEQFALVIGSLMLFVALAAVMFATRRVEWSKVSLLHEDDPAPQAQDEGDS